MRAHARRARHVHGARSARPPPDSRLCISGAARGSSTSDRTGLACGPDRLSPTDRIVRRTRRRDGARKQRRPVGNPRAREAFRCARGEGAALRRARMRDGAVDVQPLGHVLRAYVADAATAARGVVGETLGSVGRTERHSSEHRRQIEPGGTDARQHGQAEAPGRDRAQACRSGRAAGRPRRQEEGSRGRHHRARSADRPRRAERVPRPRARGRRRGRARRRPPSRRPPPSKTPAPKPSESAGSDARGEAEA